MLRIQDIIVAIPTFLFFVSLPYFNWSKAQQLSPPLLYFSGKPNTKWFLIYFGNTSNIIQLQFYIMGVLDIVHNFKISQAW